MPPCLYFPICRLSGLASPASAVLDVPTLREGGSLTKQRYTTLLCRLNLYPTSFVFILSTCPFTLSFNQMFFCISFTSKCLQVSLHYINTIMTQRGVMDLRGSSQESLSNPVDIGTFWAATRPTLAHYEKQPSGHWHHEMDSHKLGKLVPRKALETNRLMISRHQSKKNRKRWSPDLVYQSITAVMVESQGLENREWKEGCHFHSNTPVINFQPQVQLLLRFTLWSCAKRSSLMWISRHSRISYLHYLKRLNVF